MKVAIVHELFTQRGGAEHVALLLAKQFADADIFTLSYNKVLFKAELGKRNVISPRGNNVLQTIIPAHHLLAPKFSRDVQTWDFSAYDLVISSSSSFAHQINVPAHVQHICYVHSPARYLWDRTHDVRKQVALRRFGTVQTWYFDWLTHRLRERDASIDHSQTTLLAASKEVQRRIELYWRCPSTVVYPPISNHWFNVVHSAPPTKDYYAIVSTLAPYKQIELAVQACNALQLPLKIAGTGPALTHLQSIAGPTIQFLGHTTGQTLVDLYYNAKAVLFPGNEDFGLVPLEAMSQGTPVIGQAIGGALETIIPNVNGALFAEPTVASLQLAIQNFDEQKISSVNCMNTAAQFNETTFIAEVTTSIK